MSDGSRGFDGDSLTNGLLSMRHSKRRGIRLDDEPFLGRPGVSANSHIWFTERDMTVFPWLLPAVRFESWNGEMLDPTSGEKESYTDVQFVPGVVALVRANVKLTLRASFGKLESEGDTKILPGQVQLLLTVGV